MTLVKFNTKTRNSAPYFNNVFDALFSEGLNKNYGMHRTPNVNIIEREGDYRIELAAPGLSKADFQINIKKDTLSVWVEKKAAEGEVDPAYNHKEFDYKSFARSFNLPENVDNENITAEYVDGILNISIAKVNDKMQQKEIKVS